ncbi:MAG: succinate dehydrogenase assembly factor 2 [Alphaproteobacteria bacterium]|nr:succinate dehydrogenase assembly factor 2 [Alphaproteobacteria bacterium]
MPDPTLSPQDESRENRIRRLIYRSSYTGTKETDKLLGAFAREQLAGFDDAELTCYEDLLDFGDPVIWSWISLQSPEPANIDNPALTRLMAWCRDRS